MNILYAIKEGTLCFNRTKKNYAKIGQCNHYAKGKKKARRKEELRMM